MSQQASLHVSMSSQKGYSADWLAFIVLLIILDSSLNANVRAGSAAGLCACEAELQPGPQGAPLEPERKESAEACCCLVTVKRNGQSNCVVPELEESHQPRASAVKGHKDSTKNAALPPTRRAA